MLVPYATVEDFLDQVQRDEAIELSNQDDPNAGAINRARILMALQNATQEINSYLGGRYKLPLEEPTPDYLRYACIVVTRKAMDLYSDREKVRKDYDDVIARLKAIASRTAVLIGNDGVPVPEFFQTANTPSISLGCI